MYVKAFRKVNNTTQEYRYDEISNLSFAPEVDITGQSLPINEFYVDIHTEDDIPVSSVIKLYDDSGKMWAKYYIVYAEHEIPEVLTVRAESILARMDRVYVPAVMYTGSPTVLKLVHGLFNDDATKYYIDPTIASMTITGYFPKQTKKERLQWICFAVGAYVKTFFTRNQNNVYAQVEILKLDVESNGTEIPANKVFWRPQRSFSDYVESITITQFTFTKVSSSQINVVDEWIEADGEYYSVGRSEQIFKNPNIERGVATQEIVLEDVYIVTDNNTLSRIASLLGMLYFKRDELDADLINNGEYEPAHKVRIPLVSPDEDSGAVAIGYLDSCDFSFGTQARSKIHMTVQSVQDTVSLTIVYIHDITKLKLGKSKYNFPVGFSYSLENPYLDQMNGKYRYVYYPKLKYATGTIAEGTNTNNQYYDNALIYNNDPNHPNYQMLAVLSVSEAITWQDYENGVLRIE